MNGNYHVLDFQGFFAANRTPPVSLLVYQAIFTVYTQNPYFAHRSPLSNGLATLANESFRPA